ncbi:hypothetical protein [Actinokineospora enzanensis]|uniref:hypothetical protein n=1 Tax=Actinokineospora enzanensis TaxID=155975 RepID=UPI0003A57102|nr:hypothetical protein [Actinokineospora enzanensis]
MSVPVGYLVEQALVLLPEPVRLLLIVEASPERLSAIVTANPNLNRLAEAR